MKSVFPAGFGEEMAAKAKARALSRANYRKSVDLDNTFCPLDLGDWLFLCERAGVPYIPARAIAEADCADLCAGDEPWLDERLVPFWSAVELERRASLEAGRQDMFRWSVCACAEVKSRLSEGRSEWAPELLESFHSHDLRAFDLIMDFPKPTIKAWIRPWMSPLLRKGYPVEFRAFVENDEIIGISSYYPQRSLGVSVGILHHVSEVAALTGKLLANQGKKLNLPQLPRAAPHLSMEMNHWSADFMVVAGKVLFLEGGPPHTRTYGAHPCCFPVGGIEGIALRAREGMAGDVAKVLAEQAKEGAEP